VSPQFLASRYITNEELPKRLEAADAEGLTIFWIPLRFSAYQQSAIARFLAAHPPDRPLAGLGRAERDRAYVNIGDQVGPVLGVSD
jgi:hypothetical protein